MGNKKTKKAESWVTKNKGGRELGYKKTKKAENWVIKKQIRWRVG